MYINKYFQIQKTKFENNFNNVLCCVGEEAIHDMRVSIKRLRLLYKFIDNCSEKKLINKKHKKNIKNIFQAAAILRDLQVQQQILLQIEKDLKIDLSNLKTDYKKKEFNEIKRLKTQLIKINKVKLSRQFEKSNHKIELYQFQETCFKQYISKTLDKISTQIQRTNYHEVRKKIKELYYLWEIEYLENKTTEKLQILKYLGSLLGDWHDIEVFLKEQSWGSDEMTANYLIEKQKKLINNFRQNYDVFLKKFARIY